MEPTSVLATISGRDRPGVTAADTPSSHRPPDRASRSHVIVIGRPLRPGALSQVAQRITDVGANIETVTQLSTEPAASLEMIVRSPDPVELRARLVQAAEE